MKQHETEREVVTQTPYDKSKFGIATGDEAHLLGILRDKLYSNKILAVIREYSCNAADAHVEAGKPDLPIWVHFPTEDEPWFSVRDEGPGLNDEEIRKIYVMYGRSTKRNTNSQVGMLGLGCKSAFAYADLFNVTTIKNGMKTHYSAVIDAETELGEIAKLGSQPTTEPDGVEVQIPVRSSDFENFHEEGMFFRFWPIQPNFNIDPTYAEDPPEVLFEGDENSPTSWRIMKTGESRTYVMMGGVTYPVDGPAIMGLNRKKANIYHKEDDNSSYSMILTVPIGTVGMAASREGLEYKEATCKYLVDIDKEIRVDMQRKIDTIMEEAEDYYEAHRLRVGLEELAASRFAPKTGTAFAWRGVPVEKLIVKVNRGSSTKMQVVTLNNPGPRREYSLAADPASRILFVEKDTKGWVKRAKLFLHENPEYSKAIGFIWGDHCPDGNGQYVSTRAFFFQKYHLDSLPWVNVSDLPKLPKRPKGEKAADWEGNEYVPDAALLAKHKQDLFVYRWEGEQRAKSSWWNEADVLEEGPKLYVDLDRFMPRHSDHTWPVERPNTLVGYMKGMGLLEENPVIYGIKGKRLETILAEGEWVSFFDWAHEIINDHLAPEEMQRDLIIYAKHHQMNAENLSFLTLFPPLLDEDNVLRQRLGVTIHGAAIVANPQMQAAWSYINWDANKVGLRNDLQKVNSEDVPTILDAASPLFKRLIDAAGWNFHRYHWHGGSSNNKTEIDDKDHVAARILNVVSRHDPELLQVNL